MVIFWLIVAIASIVIEIITLGNLICIWFAIGALVSAILAWLKVYTAIQYIVFFVASILAMLIIRPLAAEYLRGNTVPTNADRLIGKTGVVTREITSDSWGEVLVMGVRWSAISVDNTAIKKDTKVKIMAIDGVKLMVTPVE
ncbi:MAG: NfeD family protein [Erysipelotrichaceae bacterium]|jgi:membrane protein implicated in regulation of membrane protease activity|nr:NfeD family protein [Erysipelotrichaceae bacterium]MBR2825902.1 NfeD family protein [Erysipelotrichaceae bacterium]